MELCSSQVIYILNKQNLQLVGQRRSLVFSCQMYQQQQNCACLQVQSPYKNRWHSGFCLQKAKFTVSWSNKITRFLCQTYQLQQKFRVLIKTDGVLVKLFMSSASKIYRCWSINFLCQMYRQQQKCACKQVMIHTRYSPYRVCCVSFFIFCVMQEPS